DVEDLASRAPHDAGEDRGLVLEQEGAEGDGEHETEVLGPVAGQHSEGDEVHEAPLRPHPPPPAHICRYILRSEKTRLMPHARPRRRPRARPAAPPSARGRSGP